jgi:hypothetical protein
MFRTHDRLSSEPAPEPPSREPEVDLLVDLARCSRVTVLYGDAAPGRGRVVRATMDALMRDTPPGTGREIVVLFDAWDRPPLPVLHQRMMEAVATATPVDDSAEFAARPLADSLAAWQKVFDLKFIIVFDRFEDYLHLPAGRTGTAAFDAELVRIINEPSLRANVLFALAPEAEPLLLERFRTRVRRFADSSVRLSAASAARAGGAVPGVAADEIAGVPRPVSGESPPAVAHPDGDAAPSAERASLEADAAARDVRPHLKLVSVEELEREMTPLQDGRHAVPPAAPAPSIEERPPVESADSVHKRPAAPPRRMRRTAAWIAIALVVAVAIVVLLAPRAPVAPPQATPAAPPPPPALSEAPEAVAAPEPAAPGDPLPAGAPLAAGEQGKAPAPEPQVEAPGSDIAAAPAAIRIEPALQSPVAETTATPAPPSGAPGSGAVVSIFVRSPPQRSWAERAVAELGSEGPRIAGISVVNTGPTVSDLRYFRPAEREEAEQIARAFEKAGFPVQQVKEIGGLQSRAIPRHFEIWLAPAADTPL